MRYLVLLLPLGLLGQTTVYLRDATHPMKFVTGCADTGTGPTIRCTIVGHGLSVADKVNIDGVRGCYRANGTRTVSAVVNADTIDVKGRDGTTLLECGGTYSAPGGVGSRYYTAGKLVAYTLKAPPNVMGFDGPAGTFTTAIQSRTKVGNPAYDAMKIKVDERLGSGASPYNTTIWSSQITGPAFGAAVLWHIHGRSTCSGGTITERGNGTKFCTTDATWEYLDMARWWLNNTESVWFGPGCDESISNCARVGFQNAIDQNSPEMHTYPVIYSIIYDQLTAGERTAFSNKMLNNVKLNNSSETGCTNQYIEQTGSTLTGTNGATTVTASVAADTADVVVGEEIRWNTPNTVGHLSDRAYVVTNVNTGTGVITISPAVADGSFSATSWYRKPAWTSANCGFVWLQGHFQYNLLWTSDAFPTIGGDVYSSQANLVMWRMAFYAAIGAATCPNDVRGCELFERAEAFYYDRVMLRAKNIWTGFTQAGSGTYQGRVQNNIAMMAQTLKAALTPSLDTTDGVWLKRVLLRQIYDNLPGSTNGSHFHSWGEVSQRSQDTYQLDHVYRLSATVSDQDEANRARHWLFNRYPFTSSALQQSTGMRAPDAFLYADYDATRSDYTALSPQHLFQQTDLNTPPQNYLGAYSKTGWGNTDTSILLLGGGSWEDHWLWASPGTYAIFKGNYLFADDRGTSIGNCITDSCFSAQYRPSNSVMVDPSNTTRSWDSYAPFKNGQFDAILAEQGSYVELKRWAGTNPTGRPSGEYTYFAFDYSTANDSAQTSVTLNRAWTHYLHLKAGGRDWLLRYDDVGLSASRAMRRHMHFTNNGGSSEGTTTMDAAGVVRTTTNASTSMYTYSLLPTGGLHGIEIRRDSATVLRFNTDASAGNPRRDPGLGCSYTASATATISAGSGTAFIWISDDCVIHVGHNGLTVVGSGVTIDAAVTAYPGGAIRKLARWPATSGAWATTSYVQDGSVANSTNQVMQSTLYSPAATSHEFLVAHEIRGDTAASSVTPTLLASTNFRTVQLEHATLSAIVAFSQAGASYTSWAATTTNTANAIVVVLGLSPGTYELRRAGTPICSSIAVTTADNSLYCAGVAAGDLTAVQTGALDPVVITTTSPLPNGTVGASYSQTFTATGGDGGRACTLDSGTLPSQLTLGGTGNCTLAGTPDTAETQVFNIKVCDTQSPTPVCDTDTFSLTIDAAPTGPTIITSSLPDAILSFSYSATVTATCPNTPCTWSIVSGALPTGFALANQTSTSTDITEDVVVSTAGLYEFTLRLTDAGALVADKPLSITVGESPNTLELKSVQRSSTSMIVRVGVSGLAFDTTCTLTVRLHNEVGGEVAGSPFSTADTGGTREFIVTGLSPLTTYHGQPQCAERVGSFSLGTTSTTPTGNKTVRFTATNHTGQTAFMRIEYGATGALGSDQDSSSCNAGASCSLTISGQARKSLIYYRRKMCAVADTTCASPLYTSAIKLLIN